MNIDKELIPDQSIAVIDEWLDSAVDDLIAEIDNRVDARADFVPTELWGIGTKFYKSTDGTRPLLGIGEDDGHIMNAEIDGGLPRSGDKREEIFMASGYAMARTLQDEIGTIADQPIIFGVSTETWYAQNFGDSDSGRMPSERPDRKEGILIILRTFAGTGKMCFRTFKRRKDNSIEYADDKWVIEALNEDIENDWGGVLFEQLKSLHTGATIALMEGLGISLHNVLRGENNESVAKKILDNLLDALPEFKGEQGVD